ncbi:MAG TPA: hypothetical protein VGW34_13025 [Allosphingosinicella sp.]|nr:hypothetical protein [Allosphingosinicella sp.]
MPDPFRTLALLRDFDPFTEELPADGLAEITEQPGKKGPWRWTPGPRSGRYARGSITLLSKGHEGHWVDIDGHRITLMNTATGPAQVDIAGGPSSTGTRLRDYINAQPNLNVVADLDLALAGKVTLRAKTKGLAGNLIALSAGPGFQASFLLSGPLLTGGVYNPTIDHQYVERQRNSPAVATDAEVEIAPSVRPDGSDGTWVLEPEIDVASGKRMITTSFFGIYDIDKPTENRRMLQAAVEISSRRGWLLKLDGSTLEDREWLVDGHIRLLDNCEIRGVNGFTIVSVNTQTSAAHRAPVKLGGYASDYLPNSNFTVAGQSEPTWLQYLDWLDCTQMNATTLVLRDELAHMIPIGSTVLVRDRRFWHNRGTNGQMPLVLMPNERVAPASSDLRTITLGSALPVHIADAQVALATHPVSKVDDADLGASKPGLKRGKVLRDLAGQADLYTGGYMTVAKRVKMTGVSLESRGGDGATPGPVFASGSAAYACTLVVPSAVGRSAMFVNCVGYSTIRMGDVNVWEKAVEVALGGGQSVIEIYGIATARRVNEEERDEQNVGAIIQLGENVVGTTVRVNRLVIETDYVTSSAVLVVRAASNCLVDLARIELPQPSVSPGAARWSGAVVSIQNDIRQSLSDDHPEHQSLTFDNSIIATDVIGGACGGYVVMDNAGEELKIADLDLTFNCGLTPEASGSLPWAMNLEGEDVKVRGHIKEGDVRVAETLRVDLDLTSNSPSSKVAGGLFAESPDAMNITTV